MEQVLGVDYMVLAATGHLRCARRPVHTRDAGSTLSLASLRAFAVDAGNQNRRIRSQIMAPRRLMIGLAGLDGNGASFRCRVAKHQTSVYSAKIYLLYLTAV